LEFSQISDAKSRKEYERVFLGRNTSYTKRSLSSQRERTYKTQKSWNSHGEMAHKLQIIKSMVFFEREKEHILKRSLSSQRERACKLQRNQVSERKMA
jgi:hypothetical protein